MLELWEDYLEMDQVEMEVWCKQEWRVKSVKQENE